MMHKLLNIKYQYNPTNCSTSEGCIHTCMHVYVHTYIHIYTDSIPETIYSYSEGSKTHLSKFWDSYFHDHTTMSYILHAHKKFWEGLTAYFPWASTACHSFTLVSRHVLHKKWRLQKFFTTTGMCLRICLLPSKDRVINTQTDPQILLIWHGPHRERPVQQLILLLLRVFTARQAQ
jgi:hypothetical protein